MIPAAATGNHRNWSDFEAEVRHQMKTANEHPPQPYFQISEARLDKVYDDHEAAIIRAYWHQAVREPATWTDLAKKAASSVRSYRGLTYDLGITKNGVFDEGKRQEYIVRLFRRIQRKSDIRPDWTVLCSRDSVVLASAQSPA